VCRLHLILDPATLCSVPTFRGRGSKLSLTGWPLSTAIPRYYSRISDTAFGKGSFQALGRIGGEMEAPSGIMLYVTG
jgi:hypothetical protein